MILSLTFLPLSFVSANGQESQSSIAWGNFSPFLTLNDSTNVYDIAPYIYITSDPDRKFSYKDIYERHTGGLRGSPAQGSVLTLGASLVPYWIVFSVENKSWNDDWVISLGQHMDGRVGTLKQVFLYEHFTRTRYLDNVTPQKNSYIQKVSEIDPYAPATIARGKKAMFVMYVEPSPGGMVTLVPQLIKAGTFDRSMQGPFNKTALTGFFFLMMTGIFLGAYIFEKYYSCLLLAAYYVVQAGLLYYQNNTLSVDFPFSAQVSGVLMALTGVIGLFATKPLLRVGVLQSAQGSSVTTFIIALFMISVIGSFVIPSQTFMRPLVVYGAVLISYVLLLLLSLAQGYRKQIGAYRISLAWALGIVGLGISMVSASGIVPSVGFMVAAYWYASIPQGILFASAVAGILLFEEKESMARHSEESEEKERLDQFRQSKESTEIVRLRKLIEHEREVMNELREREVQQNEEMRKAKEGADEANRAKSAFLAVISHEIRTPMTGIMGMVRLLQDTMLSSDQREYAQTIQDSGDAMVSLLNDILDFEKIESGKMDLEHLDFDLHRLLNGIITLMSGHAATKGIALKIEMDENVPRFVIGDPVRLRQVLLNLTGNSIKFTSEGSVTLQVRLEQMEQSRMGAGVRKIYFGIKDTGIGISKAAQKNLFSPFSQADSTITRKFGGTGLGLTISQRLIEAMGGKILIDSVEGQGSTFYFSIVMKEGSSENADKQQGGSSGGKMQKSDKSLRILIVEDNEINQRLLKEFVDRMGHEVVLAGSGEDAMKIVSERGFDMVLMDIELPGMSGMGTTKAIRALADKKKAAMPVIALSGNVRDEDIRACYAANMNGHLSKPVDPKRLKQMIDKVISGILDNPVIVEESAAQGHLQVNKLGSGGTLERPEPESRANAPVGPENKGMITAQSLGITELDMSEDSFDSVLKLSDDEVAVSTAGAGVDVFDPAQLQTLRNSMKPVSFMEIIETLLDKADEIVAGLYALASDPDIKTVAARAHDLKGMTGNYGLKELSALAANLEKAAKDGRRNDVSAILSTLPNASRRARAAVEEWMQ